MSLADGEPVYTPLDPENFSYMASVIQVMRTVWLAGDVASTSSRSGRETHGLVNPYLTESVR